MSRKVTVVNAHPRYRVNKRTTGRYVRHVLLRERLRNADVTVVFIDARRSRKLNRTFLSHNYATDVISFPLEEGERPEGEVYVNLDKAKEQARRHGVRFGNELARLVIHGTLHLVGYTDTRRADARSMRKRESAYVKALFPDRSKERKR